VCLSVGCVLVKGCPVDEHRGFERTLFLSPPGADDNDNDFPIRLLLSSFYYHNDKAMGIPDGLSDCSLCKEDCGSCISTPLIEAHKTDSKGYDGGPGTSEYTRVHRDQG
jgi:alpha-amylase